MVQERQEDGVRNSGTILGVLFPLLAMASVCSGGATTGRPIWRCEQWPGTYMEGSEVVLVGRDVLNTYGATVRAVIVRRTEPPERWVVRLEGSGVELAVLPEQVADLRRCRP